MNGAPDDRRRGNEVGASDPAEDCITPAEVRTRAIRMAALRGALHLPLRRSDEPADDARTDGPLA